VNSDLLLQAIESALLELEERGEIVLCTDTPNVSSKYICSAIKELTPNEKLTLSELSGLRALVFQAVNDQRFFDWEMPTLTGLDANEFKKIAEKLPKGWAP